MFTLQLAGCTEFVCRFLLEWARRPTPHEPLPDIRVMMEAQVFYPHDSTSDIVSINTINQSLDRIAQSSNESIN